MERKTLVSNITIPMVTIESTLVMDGCHQTVTGWNEGSPKKSKRLF